MLPVIQELEKDKSLGWVSEDGDGEGEVFPLSPLLVIRQTVKSHAVIAKFLEK